MGWSSARPCSTVGSVDGQERIFSASLDNTIRQWDPYDLACIRTFEEYRSEVACMVYVGLNKTLVTGRARWQVVPATSWDAIYICIKKSCETRVLSAVDDAAGSRNSVKHGS